MEFIACNMANYRAGRTQPVRYIVMHCLKKIWFYLKPEHLLLFQKNHFFKFH